ncbi:DUF1168-domain-containing protein [Lichtheimia hyalospora FSU 10163]|nr:DUF1168-domain-containing protein [Lichtheimia hyalospora FSU 10163]
MAEDEKKDDQQQRVSRHKLSVTQKTQQQLEKMFSRIDKPVHIPEPPKEKSVKPPKDFVRNVPGSSAGAGSGDFHVYRAHRRREYARLKEMDEKERKEYEQQLYEEERAALKAQDEERTAKKRARRQKRKQNKESAAQQQQKKQKTQDDNDTK